MQNVAISRCCFVKNSKNIMHACQTAIVLIAVAVEVQLLCRFAFSLSGLFQDCFYVFVNANDYQNNTKN